MRNNSDDIEALKGPYAYLDDKSLLMSMPTDALRLCQGIETSTRVLQVGSKIHLVSELEA